jgi:hypothetical protein
MKIHLTKMNCPCPHLPEVDDWLDPEVTRRHGQEKGAAYYRDALRYSQFHWQSGKPAQALLQLNKAWIADLTNDQVLLEFPPPYQAMLWMIHQAAGGERGYLGNPVRHFQHLASRMSGPRAEVRRWRAWMCFHLSERCLGQIPGFPRDGEQLVREGLWIPGLGRVLEEIADAGWRGEAEVIASLEIPLAFISRSIHRREPWQGQPE